MTLPRNSIHLGDCLDIMPAIPDESIDMILCDLPYGITACEWDKQIPLDPLWAEYRRILKKTGVIALTASQPFASVLVCGNLEWFKYEWIWIKSRATGPMHSKNMPLKKHENILIFSPGAIGHKNLCKNRMKYNPQEIKFVNRKINRKASSLGGNNVCCGNRPSHKNQFIQEFEDYPTSTLGFNNEYNVNELHPTLKPVVLFEYLIKTYTDKGDIVLDNCAGSGTTGVAAYLSKRNYILIEKEKKYYDIAVKRLRETEAQRFLL